MIKKFIKNRIKKKCSICGQQIKVLIYTDRTYRAGHYFGNIPVYSQKELKKSLNLGTIKKNFGGLEMQILKKEPVPYRQEEYWECPRCYWG